MPFPVAHLRVATCLHMRRRMPSSLLRSFCASAWVAAACGVAALVAQVAPAGACSLAGNGQHYVDAAFASDTVAPGAVTASAEIFRHEDDGDGGGCGQYVASCGSYAVINLQLSATDDAAPADRLGFEITVVDGTPPRDFNLPQDWVSGGEVFLYYSITHRTGYDITLQIRAVDLNGNLGPPTLLNVKETAAEEEEPGGCSTVPAPSAVSMALASVLFAVRRRRRR